ncbi:hypothetical protein AFLA_011681 [Aspergillus flavus NRRL3357]|nr:hypothetical protein AFLA_011681 [Aspergillus flavus NRRL3357]
MPKPGLQEMTGDRAAGMQDHLNKDRAGTPHHISILRVRKLDELSHDIMFNLQLQLLLFDDLTVARIDVYYLRRKNPGISSSALYENRLEYSSTSR